MILMMVNLTGLGGTQSGENDLNPKDLEFFLIETSELDLFSGLRSKRNCCNVTFDLSIDKKKFRL